MTPSGSKFAFSIILLFALLAALLGSSLAITVPAHALGTCYVNDNASGTNSGTSWANAYTSLQTALADLCTEIWVAAGTYKPHASDRTVSFALENGTAIYGGFAGTETLLAQRDPDTNLSILSGDLNGNDSGFTNNGENSYHVVYGNSINNTAVLDGFTITAGNADGSAPENQGGGMLNAASSNPTLANLLFSGNSASLSGGGMTAMNSSSPALTDVTFSNNSAASGGGMANSNSSPTLTDVTFSDNSVSDDGGGLYNSSSATTLTNVAFSDNEAGSDGFGDGGGMYNTNSSPTLTDVTFSDNEAGSTFGSGGGMNNYFSSPILTDVTFNGNATSVTGGGMYNEGGIPSLTNVTFSDNISGFFGGGVHNRDSDPTLTNVTFSNNQAGNGGGGMSNAVNSAPTLTNVTFSANSAATIAGGMYNVSSSSPLLKNVIIANSITNSASGGDCVNDSSSLNAASSNNLIEDAANACGLTDGDINGNITGSDPMLDGLADNGGDTQTFGLLAGSPAIDAGPDTGCPADDQRGLERPQGVRCDIGSYEFENLPLIVTNNNDSGVGSLRAAITFANGNNGADTILFDNDYTIALGSALPNITDTLTIDGESNLIIINANANHVMDINSGITAALNRLTIQNGSSAGDGGAIINHGALSVTNSTFTNNSADNGGAIKNENGTLTITHSTFDNNSADDGGGSGDGGAIIILVGTVVTIEDSAFDANSAVHSGGSIQNNGTLSVKNSTFSGNSADISGGGIRNNGTLTVTNSTFSGNSATALAGGGIYGATGTLTIRNSTLSGNSAFSGGGGGIYNDTPSMLNYANTIIANSPSGGDCLNSGPIGTNTKNLVENGGCSALLSGDPMLGPLANNGGPTQTLALLGGSPAINAGDDATCAAAPVSNLDQRGFTRSLGAHCDIGAFEKPFSSLTKWTSAFDLSHGWTVSDYVRTVGDVNNDGNADLVGFGQDGVYVALSTGSAFGAISKWTSAFDLSHGWTVSDYVRTVGDVSGDGNADLVGFGQDGVYVALSTGSAFGTISKWTSAFDLSHGWTVSDYVRTVGDVSGDGMADLVGFGQDGVYVAK